MRPLALSSAALVLLLALSGLPCKAAEIRIGASAVLSGPARRLGERFHAGSRAHFEQFNQRGGLQGDTLRLDLRDDGYEAERADANTRALVEDPRVLALFGYVGTPTSRMALPYLKRNGIALVGAFSGADMLYDPALTQSFPVRASYQREALALVDAMREAGVKHLGVLIQADPFGRAGLEALRKALPAAGIQTAGTTTIKRNSVDVDEAVESLIGNTATDGFFIASSYATSAAFIRKARSQGHHGPFFMLSFTGIEPLRDALQQDPSQVVMTQVVPSPLDASVPIVADYQNAMRARGDSHFDAISLEGYIAARALTEALRHARRPLTRASVLNSLNGMGDMDLGGFKLHMGPGGERGGRFVSLIKSK